MTLPLMVLAVGAIVAGFVSIPPALGGGAALEHFLEPSLTAPEPRRPRRKGRPRRRQNPSGKRPLRKRPVRKPRMKSRTFPMAPSLG